jgi:hypothetical protein
MALAAAATATTTRVNRLRWWLAPAAASFYAAIETGERLIGAAHHHGPVHLPTLLVGSGVALILGLVAALLLRVGERVATALRSRRLVRSSGVENRSASTRTPVPAPHLARLRDRGPPVFPVLQPAA